MTLEPRRAFHESLADMQREVLAMGAYAGSMVDRAVRALVTRDDGLAAEVVAEDDELDERYLAIEAAWLEMMALQTPVAGDLRLMSVILHTNHSVERIGDQAVSTAAAVALTSDLPADPPILTLMEEMGDRIVPMLDQSLRALERRDLDLALSIPAAMGPVEVLNRSMVEQVAACRDDPARLEWGIRMAIVSRNLGRVASRAIDIAEQTAFLLSGEFREFTSDPWDPQGRAGEEN